MPPNWKKFQKIATQMIDKDLGGEQCIIKIPSEITYDFINGESQSEEIIDNIQTALIPINKDDLKNLPEGLREKITRKIYTTVFIPKNATIISVFDNCKYKIITPCCALTAGGLIHGYRTFLGKVETTTRLKED